MGLFTPNIDQLADNNDIGSLLKLITHRRANVRLNAFLALARSRDEGVLSELKKMIKDPDPKVRAIATLKFGELGDEESIGNLRSIIISGTQREKIEALRVIAGRGKNDPGISKILFLALNDGKMIIKLEAVRSMGAVKDKYSIKHLIAKLDDKSYQMRAEVVKALGDIRDESTVDPLIGSLVDNNSEVRRAAHDALKKVGTESALKAINDAPFMLLVKRMNEGEAVRAETVKQIGNMRLKEGLPLLQKACTDEYKNIRLEAVHSIGIMRDASCVDTVLKLLDDPYFDVRIEAVRALEKIYHPSALKGLETALKDKNRNVRDEAQKAYYSLKSRLERAPGGE